MNKHRAQARHSAVQFYYKLNMAESFLEVPCHVAPLTWSVETIAINLLRGRVDSQWSVNQELQPCLAC